jgi:hypothetical protein
MGRGNDASTYGFCNENRDDIVEGGREIALVVMLSDHYKRRCSKKYSGQKKSPPSIVTGFRER